MAYELDADQAEDKENEQPAPVMVEPPPVVEEDEQPPAPDPTTSMPRFGADTLYSPENMHVLIFDWLNATFPHPENKMVNGAQGGVGSGYFSWCFSQSIGFVLARRADGQRNTSQRNRTWCSSS